MRKLKFKTTRRREKHEVQFGLSSIVVFTYVLILKTHDVSQDQHMEMTQRRLWRNLKTYKLGGIIGRFIYPVGMFIY